MSEEQYHSASHCKYLIQYHIIWCPKFRFSVLRGDVEDTLKLKLQKICDDYKMRRIMVKRIFCINGRSYKRSNGNQIHRGTEKSWLMKSTVKF